MNKEIIEDLQIYMDVLSKNLNSVEILVSLLEDNITTTSYNLSKFKSYVKNIDKNYS